MSFDIKLDKGKDKTFKLTITVSKKKVKEIYNQVLEDQAKKIKTKGFRKGKVPPQVAEQKIDKQKLNQITLQQVANQAYSQAIKDHDLKPIISPQLKIESNKPEEDWKIVLTSCELPDLDLNKVTEKIKQKLSKDKIWTPDKKDTSKAKEENLRQKEKQFQEIFKIIINTVKIQLPQLVIDQEINRKLIDLIDQLEYSGLNLQQYLQNKNTDIENLKKQYARQIEENWKLELALEKIADQNKITVEKEDLEALSNKSDKKINPYLGARILRRRKTLDFLANL